jgi:hypothetical protein
MTVGNYLRIAGYASLCGVLLLVVLMQPLAGLQPLVLRVPQDYSTIQAAVNAAPEGATILIGPGTYVEQVTITKDLTFEGSGMGVTILEPPEPPSPLDEPNPVFTVQAPERTVTLRVRQLTVGSQSYKGVVGQGIGIKVLSRASLVLEQSAWVSLIWVIFDTEFLERLEIRDSLFERNYAFIFVARQGRWVVGEVILERNRFTQGAGISVYMYDIYETFLPINSLRILAHDNTVICDPEFPAAAHSVGMAFGVGGQAEIARNLVALCDSGLVVFQGLKGTQLTIRDNWLLNNNRNLLINEMPQVFLAPIKGGAIDWLIEGNTIVGGGIGIEARILNVEDVEGRRIHLLKNWIAQQRKQHLGVLPPTDFSLFGNGVLLYTSLKQKDLREPLTIEISENRIEDNEAWGLALNLIPGWDSRPDQCNTRFMDDEYFFTDLEITGNGNNFRNNGKGDLCPPNYPWPPGFRK